MPMSDFSLDASPWPCQFAAFPPDETQHPSAESDHDFKLAGCGVQPSLRGEASRPVGGLAAPSTYPGQRLRCGARTLD